MIVLKIVVHVLQILVCNDFGMLNSGKARWKRCRGQGMEKGLRTSRYFPGLPFSPNLHVFLKDLHMGFPGDSDGKVSARNARDRDSIPGLGRSPEEKGQPTPAFMPGKSHSPRSLVGYSSWGCKESDTTE